MVKRLTAEMIYNFKRTLFIFEGDSFVEVYIILSPIHANANKSYFSLLIPGVIGIMFWERGCDWFVISIITHNYIYSVNEVVYYLQIPHSNLKAPYNIGSHNIHVHSCYKQILYIYDTSCITTSI